jgi:trehalose 6-phosphate synthase/phosphatase
MEPYVERCEGSFIEFKEASVVWQYRDCDPELGKAFANIITIDIENSLKNFNMNIINGKGYVEVKPKGVNKVRIKYNIFLGCFCFIYN